MLDTLVRTPSPPSPEAGPLACGTGRFAHAQQYVDRAAALGLSADLRALLRTPQRELTVRLPVRGDDGRVRLYTGYRVQHSLARGPLLGGLRYHPQLTLDAVRALALRTTWQCALANLPFGGAAGGVVVAPEQVSAVVLERISRRYTSEVGALLGPDRDVLMPDTGTDAQVMAWAMDTRSMQRGYTVPAATTGKPRETGGSHGHNVVARGVVAVLHVVCAAHGRELNRATVGVLGGGCNVAAVAEALAAHGAQVVPLGDDTSACDLLLLGTIGASLTAAVRAHRAPMVVELGDALDPRSDAALHAAGRVVVPDVLSGLGRVIASYFEWAQGLQQFFWSECEVHTQLERVAARAAEQSVAWAQERRVSLRLAAMALALDRVAQAIAARGIYP